MPSEQLKTISHINLMQQIGAELGVSRWYLIDQSRISAFADVTEDHQFIHIDAKRAKCETPFEGTIAHGFLTLSLLSSMYEDALPKIDGSLMSINYGINRLRFLTPVPEAARVRGRFVLKNCVHRDATGNQNSGNQNSGNQNSGNQNFSDDKALDQKTLEMTWNVTIEIDGFIKPALVCELVFLDVSKPTA